MLRPHLPVALLLAASLPLPSGCAHLEGGAPRPAPERTFHVYLTSSYDDMDGGRWSVQVMPQLRHEPDCAPLSPRAQAHFGGTPLQVSTGGMHDVPGLNLFWQQRCNEPGAYGTVALPAQENGPAVSRQVVLRDGARLIQATVTLGHWRLMGHVRGGRTGEHLVRPGDQVVLEWNQPEAPPREVQVTLGASYKREPVPFQFQGSRLSVRLPGNLKPGNSYSLSLSTKVEDAVSGCVGSPRCSASLVHQEYRSLSVR